MPQRPHRWVCQWGRPNITLAGSHCRDPRRPCPRLGSKPVPGCRLPADRGCYGTYVRYQPRRRPCVQSVSLAPHAGACMGGSQEHGGGFGYRTRSVGRFFFFHSFGVSASCGGARAGQRASRRRRRRCSSRSRRGVGAAAGVGERDRSRSSFRHSFIQSPRCLVGGRKQPGEGRVWSGSPRPRVACSQPPCPKPRGRRNCPFGCALR